jgi:membrane protein implicated in regulation of membrane protease activity
MPDRYSDPFFTKRYRRYERWNERKLITPASFWIWVALVAGIFILIYQNLVATGRLETRRFWLVVVVTIAILWRIQRRIRNKPRKPESRDDTRLNI